MKDVKHRIRILAALAVVAGFTAPVVAQVPGVLGYQGTVEIDNAPFHGKGYFKFALVDPSGDARHWSNDGTVTPGSEPTAHVEIDVIKGRYAVLLGDTATFGMQPIPPNALRQGGLRLRVWFGAASDSIELLTPDQPFASVAYALMAAGVAPQSVTSDMLAPDLQIDYWRIRGVPGGLPAHAFFPGNLENRTRFSIQDLSAGGDIVNIVAGPGVEILRKKVVLGADLEGYVPIAAQETPIIIDVDDGEDSQFKRELAEWAATLDDPDHPQADRWENAQADRISVPSASSNSRSITIGWYTLQSAAAGGPGMRRYTFVPSTMADQELGFSTTHFFEAIEAYDSNNPKEIEVVGVQLDGDDEFGFTFGKRPEVESIDTEENKITLILEHNEIGTVMDWVREVVEGTRKRYSLRIGTENPVDYRGVFPIHFQFLTGFGQFELLRARLVLSFDDAP